MICTKIDFLSSLLVLTSQKLSPPQTLQHTNKPTSLFYTPKENLTRPQKIEEGEDVLTSCWSMLFRTLSSFSHNSDDDDHRLMIPCPRMDKLHLYATILLFVHN